MDEEMKPMLLCKDNPDTSKLVYPVIAFPKLDGIRCLIVDGKAKSRTMKDIPNLHIQKMLGPLRDGFDGELIVGSPTSPTVYRDTNSVVMSQSKVADFTYYVFDYWRSQLPFHGRFQELNNLWRGGYTSHNCVTMLKEVWCTCEKELLEYELKCLEWGYEGIIIRMPMGLYKQGRTTMKENNTYKLKRFVDGEAMIVGVEEEMHNTNEKVTNELGRGQRSIHKAGMVGKGTMGSLRVRDLVTEVQFSIGSGFTAEERADDWVLGSIVKYKHFPIGVKDRPRHPIFLGRRDKDDM